MTETDSSRSLDFVRQKVVDDTDSRKWDGRVHTRFPPEPNGYLHIGHAKSICLNFGIANEFGGKCNLRFDDTDPSKEDVEYVKSIKQDIRWLQFDWEDREYYASDYFEQLFEWAVQLIKAGRAYVDSQSLDEIRENRGTLTQAGITCETTSREKLGSNFSYTKEAERNKLPTWACGTTTTQTVRSEPPAQFRATTKTISLPNSLRKRTGGGSNRHTSFDSCESNRTSKLKLRESKSLLEKSASYTTRSDTSH